MKLPTRSTLAHLRFSFSIFLTPVFFFSLSEIRDVDWKNTIVLFLVLVLGVFPASHGYNSYYDRDQESIGGLEKPPPIADDLFKYVVLIETLSIGFAFMFLGWQAAGLILLYGIFSKLYSSPRVRLKSYPFLSWFTVSIWQGAVIYWLCAMTLDLSRSHTSWFVPWKNHSFLEAVLISTLWIGGSYPVTQIYQHHEDSNRGDRTLSLLLGIRGTFIFAVLVLGISIGLLIFHWGWSWPSWIFISLTAPICVVLSRWIYEVWKNPSQANFQRTHLFLKVSSCCTLISFGMIILWRQIYG